MKRVDMAAAAIRQGLWFCLLAIGLWSALIPNPRLERAPHSDVQIIRPATPEESLRADLYRLLDTPNAEVVP